MSSKAVLRPLILASTSPYRAALLDRFSLPYEVRNPTVDESEIPGEPPRVRAARLASAKANVVARQVPEAVVIGGDQVAAAHGTVLNKPGNAGNCRQQLKLLSQSSADFYTAVAVQCVAGNLTMSHVDTTTVRLRALSDAEIDRYIEREKPFDCAGGFKAESLGIALFERIDSDDPTAIVGLPLIWLAGALRTAGYTLP